MQAEITRNVRHNFTVGVLDGGLYGMGLGFASFVAILPLYFATLTDSNIIIGLVASLHMIGWQLPQVLTAGHVARLRRYKPMVLLMTLHERWPFLGLVVVALLIPTIGREAALWLSLILIVIQTMGGGLTGTAWQSMIGKLFPLSLRGTYFGAQSGLASLLQSIGVVIAGLLLAALPSPLDFALCFLLAALAMAGSWYFLALTREPEDEPPSAAEPEMEGFYRRLWRIVQRDGNFRLFLVARAVVQFSAMAVSFYTIFGVRQFGMTESTAGLLAGLLTLSQMAASPLLGWLGDRMGHRLIFALGAAATALSALIALVATSVVWMYGAFILAGVSAAVLWTTINTMSVEFSSGRDRPYYIGLSNTLAAPATLLAPIVGGWLADSVGFQATFVVAIASGIATVALLVFLMRDGQSVGERDIVAAAPSLD